MQQKELDYIELKIRLTMWASSTRVLYAKKKLHTEGFPLGKYGWSKTFLKVGTNLEK